MGNFFKLYLGRATTHRKALIVAAATAWRAMTIPAWPTQGNGTLDRVQASWFARDFENKILRHSRNPHPIQHCLLHIPSRLVIVADFGEFGKFWVARGSNRRQWDVFCNARVPRGKVFIRKTVAGRVAMWWFYGGIVGDIVSVEQRMRVSIGKATLAITDCPCQVSKWFCC